MRVGVWPLGFRVCRTSYSLFVVIRAAPPRQWDGAASVWARSPAYACGEGRPALDLLSASVARRELDAALPVVTTATTLRRPLRSASRPVPLASFTVTVFVAPVAILKCALPSRRTALSPANLTRPAVRSESVPRQLPREVAGQLSLIAALPSLTFSVPPLMASWQRRRALYVDRLSAGTGFLALALSGDSVVGYAFVCLEDGADDTFPVGDRYAELYSLVAPPFRGHRIGTELLDFVDRELARQSISDLRVVVMAGNSDAQRLYERRGLRIGEHVLYRFGAR